ncbi:MAG: Adenylate-forming enzyme [uncultured Sulfurovum sp.]|uniref:Adenylate-forming enzyme n=1 Tax=uncultured Sulfurovum sp. TaxID=269237 RepID=A0A6S6TTJ6_9BACT|nr:MAG: Adenylate-forming enzyme [uncultured Sulfurovum sp.]
MNGMRMFRKLGIVKEFLSVKEFRSKEALEAYQKEKLAVRLATHGSRFYPNSTKLEDFPIINKKIFMENFDSINTVGISKEEAFKVALASEESRNFSNKIGDISVGLSSGTSGSRGLFLVSEEESRRWAGYILKRMLPKPLLQRHKIAFFLRANSNLYESVNSLAIKFAFYDLLQPLEEHIEMLNETQPTILIAPAQVLRLLALSDDLSINPKKIISVAEVLEEEDEVLIAQRFSQKVHQVYQCTEGFLAHTCGEGNLHLNEDRVYIEKEWIDEKSGRFSPIITDFFRSSQPVIRYKLDDILVLKKEPCACGSVFTRLKKIEGRCDDILNVKDRNGAPYLLFPDFVRRAIIRASDKVEEYAVEHREDALHIYLQPLSVKNEVEKSLQKLYDEQGLESLEHVYDVYERGKLTDKRRRVKQL